MILLTLLILHQLFPENEFVIQLNQLVRRIPAIARGINGNRQNNQPEPQHNNQDGQNNQQNVIQNVNQNVNQPIPPQRLRRSDRIKRPVQRLSL